MTINQRLAAMRRHMSSKGIDAYIIPSSDPHQSEYVAEHWKGREWISGFTGSMGYVVVTAEEAAVWTDVRYFLQCEIELKDTDFVLQKQRVQGAPEHLDWLAAHLPRGSRVAFDGNLFSVSQVRGMKRLFEAQGISVLADVDLLAEIWTDRPDLPLQPVFEHDMVFAGRSRVEKIQDIRHKMAALSADVHIVTTLDDIGWTLNLRGSDVACNPVFIAFMAIEQTVTHLFVATEQVTDALKAALAADNILLHAYGDITRYLSGLTAQTRVVVDPDNLSYRLYGALSQAQILECPTFSILMKAIKNPTEQAYLRQAMVKDGVALTKAWRWLEKTLEERPVSEYEMASMMAQYRSDQPHYFGESFSAIIGYQGNGAIIHYHPTPENCALIHKEGILLLDSGGQYADGTTDITRTIALSTPTAEQKKHFTLVLKGHIALARQVFPAGTKGIQLDILARQFLWQEQLNYGHGTGHGVGFFMNVHEPPQGFVAGLNARGTTVHEAGMLTSNEPGFYLQDAYGIRIENLVLAVEVGKTDFGSFLAFETVTLFPIDTQLVAVEMLSPEERQWLNDYHTRVYEALSPYLEAEEQAWLAQQCAAI